MDAYFLVYFKQHYPTSNLKVQEVLQQDKLEYGVRVKDIELASCFREKRYTMESALYEMAELSLSQSLSVSNEQIFFGNKMLFNLRTFGNVKTKCRILTVLFHCCGHRRCTSRPGFFNDMIRWLRFALYDSMVEK